MHTLQVAVEKTRGRHPRPVMHFGVPNRFDDADPSLEPFEKTQDQKKWSLKDIFERQEWEIPGPGPWPGNEMEGPEQIEVGEGEVHLSYDYDMGDNWEHQITFVGRATKCLHKAVGSPAIDSVIFIAGEGHLCAEDCGGAECWEDLKDTFTKPKGYPDLKR